MLTATVTDCLSDAPRSAPSVDIDQALARTAAGGEVAAFEALYRRHLGRVHGVFGRMVGHRVRAEDPEARFLPDRLHHAYALRLTDAARCTGLSHHL